MDEHELSFDNIVFLDAQVAGASDDRFVASVVWLYNFQWSSWVRGADGSEVLIEQWGKSDAVVYFDRSSLIPSLMKSSFGLEHKDYINLADYCADRLVDTAKEIGIDYPEVLDDFENEHSTQLWKNYEQYCYDSLNSLLFFNAWNTALIYHIFFHACEEEVPIKVFIPWELETPKSPKHAGEGVPKVRDAKLFKKLLDSYDFSAPCSAE